MPRSIFRVVASIAALCAVLACAPGLRAQGDAWHSLSSSADGALSVSVDTRRIHRTALQVDAWLRFNHRDRQRTAAGRAYSHSVSHVQVDCAAVRSRTLQTVYYDGEGSVVASAQPAESRWEAPGARTPMEAALLQLCATGTAPVAAMPARFGALAAGRSTGWSVDYATQAEADQRALAECGANCRIVARIAGPQCAAYAVSPSSWGWASAPTRAQAELSARANCMRATRRGQRCDVRVWACNGPR